MQVQRLYNCTFYFADNIYIYIYICIYHIKVAKGDKYRTSLDSNPNLLLSISPLWLESEISEIEDEYTEYSRRFTCIFGNGCECRIQAFSSRSRIRRRASEKLNSNCDGGEPA